MAVIAIDGRRCRWEMCGCPHLTHCFLPPQVHTPNGVLISSFIFAGFMFITNRQTNHATCVTIGGILCYALWCDLIIMLILMTCLWWSRYNSEPLPGFVWLILWMQSECQMPATLKPSQLTRAVSLPVGCCHPRRHHDLFVLLSPRADIHYAIPWRVGLSRPRHCSKDVQPVPKG